jgi:hypothetical protein
MTTRNEKLSRLAIGSPCQTAWDGMQGDARRRHCRECDRYVHDLGRLTPREIEALIEASRGRLCARITRDAQGRLVTLEPGWPAPATAPASGPWLASPVAAAVVTTLLGIGSAAAAPPAPAPPAATGMTDPGVEPDDVRPQPAAAAGGGLRGRIVDEKGAPVEGVEVVARNGFDGQERSAATGADGRFRFDSLAAGVYDLAGRRDGFAVNGQSDLLVHPGEEREAGLQAVSVGDQIVTTVGGDLAVVQEPLRRVFDGSDLVVLAEAGASVVVERDGDYGEVATELVVSSTFKSRAPGRSVRVHQMVFMDEETERLAPGTKVLAFLKLRDGETGRTAVYQSADYHFGLKVLPAAELEAYGERLAALARLLRHGDPHPADVAEWLVATAEEPLTRREAAGELRGALSALARFAEKRGTTTEQAAEDLRAVVDRFVAEGGSFGSDAGPALLGAFLTEAQMERLSEAFQATPRLTEADLELFAVVRSGAGDAAVAALARKFRAAEPAEDWLDRQVMNLLAAELDDAELQALLEEADAEVRSCWSALEEDFTEENEKLVEEKSAAARKELRRRFVQALGVRHRP